jgi:hypothetical protein
MYSPHRITATKLEVHLFLYFSVLQCSSNLGVSIGKPVNLRSHVTAVEVGIRANVLIRIAHRPIKQIDELLPGRLAFRQVTPFRGISKSAADRLPL